jgi:hypothetical protein
MDHWPLLFFGPNETGSDHAYGKKTLNKKGLSRSHLHHNGRRGVDHVYFVMPNQQYSQLRIIFDSPTYVGTLAIKSCCETQGGALASPWDFNATDFFNT